MLLSSFTSPRKLALLAVFLFTGVLLLMNTTGYNGYLPKVQVPGLSRPGGEVKSSLEIEKETTIGGGGNSAGDSAGNSAGNTGESSGGNSVGNSAGHSGKEQTVEIPDEEPEKAPEGDEEKDWAWHPTKGGLKEIATSKVATSPSKPTATDSSTTSLAPASTETTFEESVAIPHEPYEQVYSKIQELIKSWTPPNIGGHWPPYDGYADKNYEPNRWEGFDYENDYYMGNGIKKLDSKPRPYWPYPDYNSESWKKRWIGKHKPCVGPRGMLLNESDTDIVQAYPSVPKTFPNVSIGSAEVTGIDVQHCFDRYHRYGPYGYIPGENETVGEWEPSADKPDWGTVRWGMLQDRCVAANKKRFPPAARQPVNLAPGKEKPADEDATIAFEEEQHPLENQPSYRQRTAILIRTWEGYTYTENDKQALRALITESSLLSGGEYQIFLFVNVKDNNARIFDDQKVYDDILRLNVPEEFHGISILWNEAIFGHWYPDVHDWQVYWHQFMPLQWFSKTHPEFAFIWNWETDARYTGNHYHFLEQIAKFARDQPRKHQWERSSRFYFPDAHGSFASWLNDTDTSIEIAAAEGTLKPVWGPNPYDAEMQRPIGPTPPTSMDDDDFTWGVGEEADLITLQPIWDPVATEWSYREKIWNFIAGVRPHFTPQDGGDSKFTHPEFPNIPRRVYINTLSRFSRRQLHAMHLENSAGRAMQAEMWPATVALHHGLKAVYAPHPIWADRKWPAWYADAIFNADANKTARWGQEFDSPYNHDREHNFAGWSWYYATEFPKALYRRWLGWQVREDEAGAGPLGKVEDWGIFEEEGVTVELEGNKDEGLSGMARERRVGGDGRMCLPGMLLHPVKRVKE